MSDEGVLKSELQQFEFEEAKEIFGVLRDAPNQSDLNEEGVPMNETDAGHIWKGWLEREYYCARIENIGVSLPDMFWIYKGVVVFNELKVRRGNLIYAPQFQYANAVKMSLWIHKWQLSYVVYNGGLFELYHFQDVRRTAKDAPSSAGKIKIDISQHEPYMTVRNKEEILGYTDYIRSQAFPKKAKPT